MKIVGISGSLRKDSYNTKLVNFIGKQLRENTEFTLLDYADLPLFNEEIEHPTPASVKRVIDIIKEADGLVIATPEYNLSYSGVLKNLIDWISRPIDANGTRILRGKKVVVLGATQGVQSTITAQEHLRSVLNYTGMNVLGQPRVTISGVQNLFDANGNAQFDDVTKGFVDGFVNAATDFFAGK